MKFNFPQFFLYRLVLGQLDTNCYLLIEKKSGMTIIIDPTDAADFIESEIQRLGAKPTLIIAIHKHFDHVLAALELQLVYNIPLLIDKNDEFLLKGLTQSVNLFLGSKDHLPPQIDDDIKDKIELRQEKIYMLHTPGYTPGNICLYNKNNGLLLSGDTLFKDGIGRTDFSYSSEKDMKQSLDKLLQLPLDTQVFPGHEAETIIARAEKNLEYTKKT